MSSPTERPEGLKLVGNENSEPSPYEKAMLFSLRNLNSPTIVALSPLFDFDEIKQKIPNADQLSKEEKAISLQCLLGETIKTFERSSRNRPKYKRNIYEVLKRISVKGQTNKEIIDEMKLSNATFYRMQMSAVKRVIDILRAPEIEDLPSKDTVKEKPMDPACFPEFFNPESHKQHRGHTILYFQSKTKEVKGETKGKGDIYDTITNQRGQLARNQDKELIVEDGRYTAVFEGPPRITVKFPVERLGEKYILEEVKKKKSDKSLKT